MTTVEVRGAADDGSVVAYEELRSRVLTGAPGHGAGWVLLLREGLAAWLEGRGACSSPSQPKAGVQPMTFAAPPLACAEIHAGMVGVLASMILAG